MAKYSWARLVAVVIKEFIQMKRDPGTFAMIIGIPLMQVVLFGYAINSDPKHLPTAVMVSDQSNFTRSLIKGMENSSYFDVNQIINNEKQADQLLATDKAQFVLQIPPNFSHDLVRGNHPTLLLIADATDPGTTGNAVSAINTLMQTVFQYDLQGTLSKLNPTAPPVDLRIQARYNPNVITQYNIVPGLLGLVLNMTMVMVTAIAITRERERGTMENLLATPVQPIEVLIGKVLPYIIVGYIQALLILVLANILFGVPVIGSITLLILAALPFIAANLAVGLLMSTVAKNQLQAVQMTIFFFLPSILLSGFMFPFRGMPFWAQDLGEVLPMTHFLRITRGIMLKGNGWLEIWPDVWPILLFLIVVILLGVKRFRRTLD